MIKTRKKAVALMLTFAMALSMGTTALAASPTDSGPKYTINMEAITDQKMRDSQVAIRFAFDNKAPITIKGDDYMGYPILMNVPSLGGITLIPIRLICEAIGVPVDWIPASEEDISHALIKSPDHGDVKLYMGATSIQAEDGTYYQETTYTFPDGSPIPLCLFRNGRTYVPVRFITNFLVDNATFGWSQNMQLLTIKGSITEKEITSEWDGIGVNTGIVWEPEEPLENMPNTSEVVEKHNLTGIAKNETISYGGVSLYNNRINNGLVLEGFDYSYNNKNAYVASIAMLKDVLDSESANAFVSWLEELDVLHRNAIDSAWDDVKYQAAKEKMYAHGNKLWKATSPVEFGNVKIERINHGNVTSFNIYNK